MPTGRTVGIALGVTTGVAVLFAIFMLVRKKHIYISFIPGLGESRDRLAARTGHEGRRLKGKNNVRSVEVPFGQKLQVYKGPVVGGGEDVERGEGLRDDAK